MLGAAIGGFFLDHVSLTATWNGGSVMLLLAAVLVGRGGRLMPHQAVETTTAMAIENR